MRNILVNNNNSGSKSYQNQNNKNSIPIYNNSLNLNFEKMNNNSINNNNVFPSVNISPQNNNQVPKIQYLNNNNNKDDKIKENLFHNFLKSEINNNNKYIFNSLFLNLKLPNGSEINETINLQNEDDLYIVAQKYIIDHNLNQNLLEPLYRKLSKSIEKTKEVFVQEISDFDSINLNKISKYSSLDRDEESAISIEDLIQNNIYVNYFKDLMPSYEESEATQLLNSSI